MHVLPKLDVIQCTLISPTLSLSFSRAHTHTHTHTHTHRVGGSLPIAFSYFCEFFSKKNRGPFVIILAGFWTLGSVFAAVTALAIIEHVNIRTRISGKLS